jgi:hypothetical protein
MESPGPQLHGGPGRAHSDRVTLRDGGRLAAGTAALTLALSSSGDVLVVAAALGVAVLDPVVGLAGAAAALGLWLRIGSTSLNAAAGAQAVLGPALVTAPVLAALGAAASASALLLAALLGPRDQPDGSVASRPADVVGAAALAALAVAIADGPGPRRAATVLTRGSVTAVVVIAAITLAGRHDVRTPSIARRLVVGVGLAGAALALAAFPGRLAWPPSGVLAARPVLTGLVRAIASAGVALVALQAWLWRGELVERTAAQPAPVLAEPADTVTAPPTAAPDDDAHRAPPRPPLKLPKPAPPLVHTEDSPATQGR